MAEPYGSDDGISKQENNPSPLPSKEEIAQRFFEKQQANNASLVIPDRLFSAKHLEYPGATVFSRSYHSPDVIQSQGKPYIRSFDETGRIVFNRWKDTPVPSQVITLYKFSEGNEYIFDRLDFKSGTRNRTDFTFLDVGRKLEGSFNEQGELLSISECSNAHDSTWGYSIGQEAIEKIKSLPESQIIDGRQFLSERNDTFSEDAKIKVHRVKDHLALEIKDGDKEEDIEVPFAVNTARLFDTLVPDELNEDPLSQKLELDSNWMHSGLRRVINTRWTRRDKKYEKQIQRMLAGEQEE